MEYINPEYFEHTPFFNDAFPFHCFEIENANTLPHWHNHMEIIYAQKGSSDVYVNGVLYSCSQKDFVIIPPTNLHSIQSKNSKYIAIVIGDTLLSCLENDYHLNSLLSPFLSGNMFSPIHVTVENSNYSNLQTILKSFIYEENTKNLCHEAIIKIELCRFFVILLRNFSNVFQLGETYQISSTQMIKTTLNYISTHYHKKISLLDMSKLNNISIQHFCRLFKSYTGKTFMEYLTFYRLDQAYKLLTATSLPITRIPELTGFCNSNYFSRIYKIHFGHTPSYSRKLHS